jgi:hypothetical protein
MLLTFASEYGVLAITEPDHCTVYVNLTRNGRTEWFELPTAYSGFLNFGPHRATVEIVATATATVAYAAQFLTPAERGCGAVHPACGGGFTLSHFGNASDPECFLVTDANVRAAVAGSLGTGELTVPGVAHFHSSVPIPPEGATLTTFTSIVVANAGPEPVAVDFAFSGGRSEREYSVVTSATPVGAVGAGQFRGFDPMVREPSYPPREDTAVMRGWMLCALVFVILPLIAAAVMGPYFVRLKTLDAAQNDTYYDSQADIAAPAEPESGIAVEEQPATPPEDVVPESPYETHAECL